VGGSTVTGQAIPIGGGSDSGDKVAGFLKCHFNEYGAALGSWMGLSNSELIDVFPDLANFDSGWQDGFGLF